MKRDTCTISFPAKDLKIIKRKMLNWASRFGIFLFLDSNEYTAQGGQYECLLGAGARAILQEENPVLPAALESFRKANGDDWLFGHLGYDLKNSLEPGLASRHAAQHQFAGLQFFVPVTVMGIRQGSNELFIATAEGPAAAVYGALMAAPETTVPLPKLTFQQRIARPAYLEAIAALREHIRNGDCYEINFCNEGFCTEVDLDALSAFRALNEASPAPFAACYKTPRQYLLCASPERFLRRQGTKIIAQPIKGTARRSADAVEDEQLRQRLYESEKERAENVMIVDLMRNDLARSCVPGSVVVDELFGIYSFPQVHQMISTVSGTLLDGQSGAAALCAAFPMGSMTGAPKVKVMQLIDRYESARRALFSGSVGYFAPDGDFDFNVVIRSLFYNEDSRYLSYQTGGAITWDSVAEEEWEEMRLKAAAMERLFQ